MKQTIVPDAEYILADHSGNAWSGVLLGFVAYLFFTIIHTAGSFIDLQIGFGMANIVDPMTGASTHRCSATSNA